MTIVLSSRFAPIRPGTSIGPVVPTVLALVAGFVNSCTLLAFGGLFVVVGAGFWGQGRCEIVKLAAIPVFMAAGVATTWLVRVLERSGFRSFTAPLVLEALLVAGLMALGGLSDKGPAASVACLFGLAAMGVHGALCRLLISDHGSTNAMTTNSVQFAIDLTDSLLKGSLEPRLLQTGRIMLAFLIGVGAGAVSFASIGFACLLAPILALGALAAEPLVKVATCGDR